jgi:exodeoxyribonuclease VII large subunit
MEKTQLTLLELTGMIGNTISKSFPGRYWLVSEINEIRETSNGHCYLELVEKESEGDNIVARSRATIWASTWRMLKPYFETSTSQTLSKGMMVLAEVNIEFHELYGLSLNIKDIDPVYTMGDIERRRAETIRQLEKEGIFNMNRSLLLPVLPSRIAVISSPHAAGYEDFTDQIISNQRKYRIEMTLFPALMQGNNAGKSVTDALDAVFEQESMFDVVVILRGGGSAADLNCFNGYEIAAHIAQFPLPVITGIGHERDHTIAGMVAHTDLKTPTAVAEFLTGRFREAENTIVALGGRLTTEVSRILEQNRQLIVAAHNNIPLILTSSLKQKAKHLKSTGSILARSSATFIQHNRHLLISEHSRFGFVIKNCLLRLKNREEEVRKRILPGNTREFIRKRADRLLLHETTFGLVDPENILKKGYALVIKDGKIIKNAVDIEPENVLETKFHDGRIKSKVLKINITINNL